MRRVWLSESFLWGISAVTLHSQSEDKVCFCWKSFHNLFVQLWKILRWQLWPNRVPKGAEMSSTMQRVSNILFSQTTSGYKTRDTPRFSHPKHEMISPPLAGFLGKTRISLWDSIYVQFTEHIIFTDSSSSLTMRLQLDVITFLDFIKMIICAQDQSYGSKVNSEGLSGPPLSAPWRILAWSQSV